MSSKWKLGLIFGGGAIVAGALVMVVVHLMTTDSSQRQFEHYVDKVRPLEKEKGSKPSAKKPAPASLST